MPDFSVVLAMDAQDPGRPAAFWARMLDRPVVPDARGLLLPGTATQAGLRFVPSDRPRTGQDRTHLHLTSDSQDDQDAIVALAIDHGASHLDVGQLPDEGHVVLADPNGNAFCVIGPDSSFLAGCGPLGELAGDATRAVGVFWSAALGWPLVWDQNGETAVQSPYGGTKVAWGGPPVAPKDGRNRQRLEVLVTGDLADEVERLVALGASRPGDGSRTGDDMVELLDPDGGEFALVRG